MVLAVPTTTERSLNARQIDLHWSSHNLQYEVRQLSLKKPALVHAFVIHTRSALVSGHDQISESDEVTELENRDDR